MSGVASFFSAIAPFRLRSSAIGIRVGAAAAALTLVFGALTAPDLARNLVMLARLRAWTSGAAAEANLGPIAAWLSTVERTDAHLQAQSAALAQERGDDDASRSALERARALAPIAGHCSSQDAMLIEHLARPLLSTPAQPKSVSFFAHRADAGTISQMRSLPFDDGPGDCMHVLTVAYAAPDGEAAMYAPLPVQPGRRYRAAVECYVTGRLDADVTIVGEENVRIPIVAREAWTTISAELAPTTSLMTTIQVIGRNGAGRIACRDLISYDITPAAE